MAGDACRRPTLDRAALMAEAEQVSGLSHWGADRTFEVGLGRLIDAVEAMPFAAALREAVKGQVTQLLATKLQLEEDARRHLEILAGEIRRPLIVVGLPVSTGEQQSDTPGIAQDDGADAQQFQAQRAARLLPTASTHVGAGADECHNPTTLNATHTNDIGQKRLRSTKLSRPTILSFSPGWKPKADPYRTSSSRSSMTP